MEALLPSLLFDCTSQAEAKRLLLWPMLSMDRTPLSSIDCIIRFSILSLLSLSIVSLNDFWVFSCTSSRSSYLNAFLASSLIWAMIVLNSILSNTWSTFEVKSKSAWSSQIIKESSIRFAPFINYICPTW